MSAQVPSSAGFNSAYSRRKRVYAATYFFFFPRAQMAAELLHRNTAAELYFNDFNIMRVATHILSYILAILIIHERIHSCLSELYAAPFIFASISTAHFFLSLPSSLSLSSSLFSRSVPLTPLFALRSRIEINDTLGASAKRDHENRFERSRRKLLDGRLNRPVGSLAGKRAACNRARAKQVRAENKRG